MDINLTSVSAEWRSLESSSGSIYFFHAYSHERHSAAKRKDLTVQIGRGWDNEKGEQSTAMLVFLCVFNWPSSSTMKDEPNLSLCTWRIDLAHLTWKNCFHMRSIGFGFFNVFSSCLFPHHTQLSTARSSTYEKRLSSNVYPELEWNRKKTKKNWNLFHLPTFTDFGSRRSRALSVSIYLYYKRYGLHSL